MDIEGGKVVKRYPADELIKANSQAEAIELSKTRARLNETNDVLQEIRKLNLKNIEIQDKTASNISQIESVSKTIKSDINSALESNSDTIRDIMEKSIDDLNKIVSERIISSLEEFRDAKTDSVLNEEQLRNIKSDICTEIKAELDKVCTSLEDFIHKEDVKVYKNVQASTNQDVNESREKLVSSFREEIAVAQPSRAGLYIFSGIAMLASIANLVITVMNILK